ncbi:MAG TPA: LysR family transcriptional regulator [Burkholderiales bacterium]|nr:LysR family transcriptional regulator [Burkholderiales bacterium]
MSLRHATLRQLQVFESVARQLSFSRAAAELHLTQPAVSMQVKLLEEQAGMPLFERIGKKVFLTEAGAELHQHSRVIAQQLRDADEALAARKGLSQGRLVITMVSTAKYLVPTLLARFLKQYPGVTVKLSANNREVVLKQLADNEVDLAIMGRTPEGMDAIAEPFARHPHVIIAAPGHPLAKKRRIPLARLAEETFLIREPGSGTRGLLERLFAKHRLPLNVSMEMASNETIKQAVQAGMGISLLSLHTIELELTTRRLVVLNVQGLPIVRDWYVVHLTAKRLSPAAQAFRAFLLSTAGKLVPEK